MDVGSRVVVNVNTGIVFFQFSVFLCHMFSAICGYRITDAYIEVSQSYILYRICFYHLVTEDFDILW